MTLLSILITYSEKQNEKNFQTHERVSHKKNSGSDSFEDGNGKKLRLIVDRTILELAKLSRAGTQRFSGKAFWTKKKRKVYSEHYEGFIEFEEVFYGMLVMVGCDEKGVVYDLLQAIMRLGL